MTLERRTFASEVESRTAGENRRLIIGYAYKFRKESQVLGQFTEQVAEGAGAASIASDDIRALFNHEPTMILGRNLSGTLRMAEDTTGLHYEIDADERQTYVRDLLIALERGDINHSSFGFRVAAGGDEWEQRDGDLPLRTLTKVSLFDVSPVTYPAYLDSESGVDQRAISRAKAMVAVRTGQSMWLPDTFDRVPIDPVLASHVLRRS